MQEKLTPLPKPTALAYALAVSPMLVPSRPGWRSKVFIWREVGTARRMTLPSQSNKEKYEKLVAQGRTGRRVTIIFTRKKFSSYKRGLFYH